MIHRDIKSDNIFCTKDGQIKLADLGLSVCLTQQQAFRKTKSGTYNFLSPEIIRNGPYSIEVDIWAFGAFIHELGTGKPPFMNPGNKSVFDAICGDPIPRVRNRTALYNDLLHKCMDRDITTRLTIEGILEHEYLEGAEDLRQNWVDDFQQYVDRQTRNSIM